MKECRQLTMAELRKEQELDRSIQERFKMERRPQQSVDGDNPWERDPFEDDLVDVWQIVDRGGV